MFHKIIFCPKNPICETSWWWWHSRTAGNYISWTGVIFVNIYKQRFLNCRNLFATHTLVAIGWHLKLADTLCHKFCCGCCEQTPRAKPVEMGKVWNLNLELVHWQEPGIWNLEPGTRNLEPGFRNLEPGTHLGGNTLNQAPSLTILWLRFEHTGRFIGFIAGQNLSLDCNMRQ